jgi:hypothetical protein
MEKTNPISEELIAPCGMKCAICSRYLAYFNKLKRSQCVGCRPRNKRCTYLFGKCAGINKSSNENTAFCFKCRQYPCKRLNHLDERYRNNYGMSPIDNLEFIKNNGITKFIKDQYKKHRCLKCGSLISTHNGKCFKCQKIAKLVEKTSERRANAKSQ